jgi:histidinol-phosphate/aromatic aminotransferase/cobyric acid decarboxylase-like protein
MNERTASPLPGPAHERDPLGVARLDCTHLPFGPSLAALEAMACPATSADRDLGAACRERIGAVYRVPAGSVRCLASIEAGVRRIVAACDGPVVVFPPSASAFGIGDCSSSGDVIPIARGAGRGGTVSPEIASDLPSTAVAVIESPADPLGGLLSAADTVRLARACRFVVVDERYAEVAGFSVLPLAVEFDNIVVLRSFATWAGLRDLPCAWAVASARAADALNLHDASPEPRAAAAMLATLDDLPTLEANLRLVRDERSRLFRLLRKLSFLEPIPSWGPFIAARVEVVPREDLVRGLAERGVFVHAPPQPGLERFVRIGLGSRGTMDRLRAALLDLAPRLIG